MLALAALSIALLLPPAVKHHAVELRDRGFTVIPDPGLDQSLVADAQAQSFLGCRMELNSWAWIPTESTPTPRLLLVIGCAGPSGHRAHPRGRACSMRLSNQPRR